MTDIKAVLRLLKDRYPQPRIALEFSDPWQSLVATILSAQCTDARVNIVTQRLFKKYARVRDYAQADPRAFEQDIRSTGFYRNKAKNIIASAKKVLADFGGRVPDTMEELLGLAGVARKTANVVLYNAFGKNEGIAVDTHVARVSQRLGLTQESAPEKIERDLMKMVPPPEWGAFSLRVIRHGRDTCQAKKPRCPECLLKGLCPSRKIYYPHAAEKKKEH